MMFGHDAFGARPFAHTDFFAFDDSAFVAFLQQVAAPRNWLLEIEGFSLAASSGMSGAFGDLMFGALPFAAASGPVSGGPVTLRYSTHGYLSRSDDLPASSWYEPRISDQIRVERAIIGRDGIGGLSRVFTEIDLANPDGGLDDLLDAVALDGRAATLLIGPPDGARAEYGVVFRGVVQRLSASQDALRIELSDGAAKLDVPIQTALYAGTGGQEGGDDLRGKPKPLAFGRVFNVAPPLVDPVQLIYQVHDGAIDAVTAVYDRGVPLALAAGAPAPGQYSVDLINGTFRLGATPAGTVTADVRGSALPTYIERTGEIIRRLLAERALLTANEIDPGSLDRLITDAPAPVGLWIGAESRTVADVIDQLLAGIGAFGGFSRSGAFTVGIVGAPAGTTALRLDDVDILDVSREPLPDGVEPVAWRAAVAWEINETVQTDLAAGVSDARRTFAAQAQRVATAEDAAIRSRRLLARDIGTVPARYALASDAQAEADRLLDLWGSPRQRLRVRTRFDALRIDLGAVIDLQHSRFGLRNSRPARVIAHAVDPAGVELQVLV